MEINRYTTSIIFHRDGVVFQNIHRDILTIPRQSLIDGVINDLVHQMVQTSLADVYPVLYIAMAVFFVAAVVLSFTSAALARGVCQQK